MVSVTGDALYFKVHCAHTSPSPPPPPPSPAPSVSFPLISSPPIIVCIVVGQVLHWVVTLAANQQLCFKLKIDRLFVQPYNVHVTAFFTPSYQHNLAEKFQSVMIMKPAVHIWYKSLSEYLEMLRAVHFFCFCFLKSCQGT